MGARGVVPPARAAEPGVRPRSEYAGPVKNTVRVERVVKAALAIAMITLVVWFFASGTYHTLSAEKLREHIRGLEELGPVVFVLAFALIQPLGPSGHIFTICASLVWPPAMAFGLSLIGAVCAQTLGFVFFRYVARDFARERIPSRVQKYEQNLVDRPFRTIVLLQARDVHLAAHVDGTRRLACTLRADALRDDRRARAGHRLRRLPRRRRARVAHRLRPARRDWPEMPSRRPPKPTAPDRLRA
jgi:hypothetical protein